MVLGRSIRALAGALLVARAALAQVESGPDAAPAPPASAPVITRPVPLETPAPPYPAGEHGDHHVVIELTVTEEGRVADARLVSGDVPFSDLALNAARAFTFRPAERDGKPVRARIRLELVFREPPPPPLEAEPAPETTPEPPLEEQKPPSPDEPVEVTVVGVREAPERVSFSRAEVREIPGTFGDPFRAIEVMPGVTPLATGLPYFYVRGSPPGNVGYFLDGIRVPLLYHFALGPSVIHPGIVERVDLYPGAYPARYGRYAGGIVAAETTPPRPELHGEANVRLFDAGALLEAPVLGGDGVALAGGRYSYTGGILSLVAPEVSLGYWDYQLRISHDTTASDRVGLFAFGSYDFFAVEESDGEEEGLSTEFHRVDLRHQHTFDAATALESGFTFGRDRTGNETLSGDVVDVIDLMFAARSRLTHRGSDSAVWRGGADVVVDNYSIDLDDEGAEETFPTRLDYSIGTFADVVLAPERWFSVTPGLRLDFYASGRHKAVGIDPRVSARFQVSRRVAIEHAFGIAHQPPSFVIPVPGFALGGLENGLQQAFQTSSGVDVELGQRFTAELTLYQNALIDLTDLLSIARGGEVDDGVDLDTRVRGRTYGLELVLRRPLTEKLGGYFAYTLSRSERFLNGRDLVASFDRTHVLHAALAYDLGRRWRAGTRLTYYTGVPAEPDFGEGPYEAGPGGGPPVLPETDERAPSFFRLDIRLEKKWPIGTKGAWWSFIFEVINTTLNKEVLAYECSPSGCEGEEFGPVTIPSIGVEASF